MLVGLRSGPRFERRRRALPLIVASLVLVLSLSIATPRTALAGGGCSGGHLGTICVTAYWNGYNAEFINHSGQCFWADFNLRTFGYQGGPSGTYGSEGAFWTCEGQYNSYFFAVGYQGCGEVIVYDRSNGQPPQSSGAIWLTCGTP